MPRLTNADLYNDIQLLKQDLEHVKQGQTKMMSDISMIKSQLLDPDSGYHNPARAQAALEALNQFDEMLVEAQALKEGTGPDKRQFSEYEVNQFVFKRAREIGDELYDPSWDVEKTTSNDLISNNAWLQKLPKVVSSEEEFKEAYKKTFAYYISDGNEWDDNQFFYKPPLYDMLVSYFELQPMDVADFENALIYIRETVEDYYAKKKNK